MIFYTFTQPIILKLRLSCKVCKLYICAAESVNCGSWVSWIGTDFDLYLCKSMKRKLKDKILLLQRIIVIFRSVGVVAFKLGSLLLKSNLVFLSLYNQPEVAVQSKSLSITVILILHIYLRYSFTFASI